jgi:uncharacterized protein (TIGR01777 family)
MNSKRIVIAGGTGFVGGVLSAEFSRRGFEVVVLTRFPRPRHDGVVEVEWNGAQAGAWEALLDGAEAVVNLAGRNLNCRHTPDHLREIVASRVNSVKAIAAAIGRVKQGPRVWVQAGAVGYYGDTGKVICDETAGAGGDTLADVCRQWEAALAAAEVPQTRKVILRMGVVLGRDGGALPVLGTMTKWFLGGAAGSGRQYLSWIHLADLAAMFAAVVADERLSGVFNAVGPAAVTNAQFMQELRRVYHRPWSPPAPAFAVRLGAWLMGSDGSLALTSQRCVPKRFLELGFQFRFADIPLALNDLCQR